MPWTAQITSVGRVSGDVAVVVNYTDGQTTLSESYRATTPDLLKQTVLNRLASLTAADEGFAKIAVGPVVPDVPPPPDPSPVDEKRAAFFAALAELRKLNDVLALGVIDKSDARLLAALADAQKTFDPKYL